MLNIKKNKLIDYGILIFSAFACYYSWGNPSSLFRSNWSQFLLISFIFLFYSHKTGRHYIFLTLALSGIMEYLHIENGASFFIFLSFILCAFFRNPSRSVPVLNNKEIISPADGQVIKIEENADVPEYYKNIDQKWTKISIFMRVYDVHINRAPVSGKIIDKNYTKGKFGYAKGNLADVDNERLSILIKSELGYVISQQVAGMLARRIKCFNNKEDILEAGEIYGIIQIGSRLDLFIPSHLKITVRKNQIVKAGLSYITR